VATEKPSGGPAPERGPEPGVESAGGPGVEGHPTGERDPTDAEIKAALEALTDRERFREAEARVIRFAPELQHVLVQALKEGGWLEAHESQVRRAAGEPEESERVSAVRSLLAEETRMGMLVGVAVGWELARELDPQTRPPEIEPLTRPPDGGER
jgi:hypothetical protein